MISVIVPVYNKAPFLRRCLNSLITRETDYSNLAFEVILVDDGSTDGSSLICDDYYKFFDFEVYHLKHKGVSEARNFGLSKATGEYVLFLDADDELTPGAIKVMANAIKTGHNIIQFGQFRCHVNRQPIPKSEKNDYYFLGEIPTYWQMVWNKLYKREFLKDIGASFIPGMQFGEDEMFNVDCIFAERGLYHISEILVRHHMDDMKSLCRGELCLERIQVLDDKLHEKLKSPYLDDEQRSWLRSVISRHHSSPTFLKYGFKPRSGQYDICYVLKDSPCNEELRYSLRSVEKNFPYRKVWFVGGKPDGLRPDGHLPAKQVLPSKWERVQAMLRKICMNDEITENFWLFNDDFFIVKPARENGPVHYNGVLQDQVARCKKRNNGMPNDYTRRLDHLIETLTMADLPQLNYAVHKPMLFNKKKLLKVMDEFPGEPMTRALYGNYYHLGGKDEHDMKIQIANFSLPETWDYCSTSDESFSNGRIGRELRGLFSEPSRFEIGG